jgi:hypothetical protein
LPALRTIGVAEAVQMFINQRWLGIPDQKIQFRTRDE